MFCYKNYPKFYNKIAQESLQYCTLIYIKCMPMTHPLWISTHIEKWKYIHILLWVLGRQRCPMHKDQLLLTSKILHSAGLGEVHLHDANKILKIC